MLFHRELEANLDVCRNCGHHLRIGAARRLQILFDDGAATRIELPKTIVDPLRFRDAKRYADRLREGQAAYGPGNDAVIVAHGRIGGQAAVVAAFEFGFMGGSMGIAAGEAVLAAARLAVMQEAALIAVPASGGARMQEGMLSLMQMPRTIIAADMVKEAGLPYIVLLTDPTTGGVSASFAMVGDVTIAEPGAIDRLCRRAGHRGDDPRKAAGGVSARRIPLRSRHGRHGRPARRAARHARTVARAAARSATGGRRTAADRRSLVIAVASDRVLARLGAAAPEADRSVARPVERLLAALGNPQDRLPPVDPCRRHQRQGLDGGDAARLPRSRRLARPRLYLAASGALSRAHPARRQADRGRGAARDARRMRARQCGASRSPISRSPPRRRFSPLLVPRPISCCSKPGLAAGSMRPTWSRRPAATAITPISLDHQAFLGDTIAAIAGEKAGILKPGVPAIIGPQPPEAAAVFAARAPAVGAPLYALRPGVALRRRPATACATRARAGDYDLPLPVIARRASDRQCRHGDRLPRTT